MAVDAQRFEEHARAAADDIAVAAERAGLGTLAFVLVQVGLRRVQGIDYLLRATAVNTEFRDRARRRPDGVLRAASAVSPGPGAQELPWEPRDELREDLRRELDRSGDALPFALRQAFTAALARSLNQRPWPAGDPGFLAFVQTPFEGDLPTRDVLGDDAVDAFLASLTTPATEWEWAPEPDDDDEDDDGVRLSSRAELAVWLAGEGVAAPVAAALADLAAWGIVLEPGSGRSRLGGPPLLSLETPWPRTHDGRPLTHLGTLAMSELPDVDGRDRLPADGHLSFFADLEDEDALMDPIEPGDTLADRRAVVHSPASPTHEASGPCLTEQRVRPTARLQIPSFGSPGAGRVYDADVDALWKLADRVNGPTPHQLLGYPTTVQDDPRSDGELSLLHLVDDRRLDFHFLDAGSLHFYAPPDDVQARRWDRVTLWTSSC